MSEYRSIRRVHIVLLSLAPLLKFLAALPATEQVNIPVNQISANDPTSGEISTRQSHIESGVCDIYNSQSKNNDCDNDQIAQNDQIIKSHVAKRDITSDLTMEGIALAASTTNPNVKLWCTPERNIIAFSITGIKKFSSIAITLTASTNSWNPVQLTPNSIMTGLTCDGKFRPTLLSSQNLFIVTSKIPCVDAVGQLVIKNTSLTLPCTATSNPSSSYLSAKAYYIRENSSVLNSGTKTTALSPIICNPHADPDCLTKLQKTFLPISDWLKNSNQRSNPDGIVISSLSAIALTPDTDEIGPLQEKHVVDDIYTNLLADASAYDAGQNISRESSASYYNPTRYIYASEVFQSKKIPSNNTITNQMLQEYIKSKVAAGATGFTRLNSLRPSIIAIHLSPNFSVSLEDVGTTCIDICGFHDMVNIPLETAYGTDVSLYYTVIPYPNNSTCKGCLPLSKSLSSESDVVGAISTHELLEVLTKIALGNNYIPGLAEIADPCSWDTQLQYKYMEEKSLYLFGLSKFFPGLDEQYSTHRVWDPIQKKCTFGTQYRTGYFPFRQKVTLNCPNDEIISNIVFASYGKPRGEGPFTIDIGCHSPTSYAVVYSNCVGKNSCELIASDSLFGASAGYSTCVGWWSFSSNRWLSVAYDCA